MTDITKAIAAAREALHEHDAYGMPIDAGTIRDLLAALDAARGEAVAWMTAGGDVSRSKLWCDERSLGGEPSPLYAAPPAALAVPASKGDAERSKAWRSVCDTLDRVCPDWMDANGKTGTELAVAAIERLAAQQPAAAVPAADRMADALNWIIRHADAPERAARGSHRGMAAIKHVAKSALAHQPNAPANVRTAWAEGYRAGVMDERTSEASIGIAGFGAKIEPARENPYATQAQRDLLIAAVPEAGLRDSVLNSAKFRASCYALVGIVEGIEGLGRNWAANGERLKDTREWVAFYNCVASMRNGTFNQASAEQAQQPAAALPDDAIEAAYWDFDARHKGYGPHKITPQSERDAFKWAVRAMLAAALAAKGVE